MGGWLGHLSLTAGFDSIEATSVNTYGEKQASHKGLVGKYFTASGSKSEDRLIYSMWVCTNSVKQAGSCVHVITGNHNIMSNLFVGQTCRKCIAAGNQGAYPFSLYPLFFSFFLIFRNFHF